MNLRNAQSVAQDCACRYFPAFRIACILSLNAGLAVASAAQAPSNGSTTAAPTPSQASAPSQAHKTRGEAASAAKEQNITEEEVRQKLEGKTVYIRGGYLDNSLSFNEHGRLIGNSPQGSFTLCLLQVDKVHLTKRRLELTGTRYGLHFLGTLPNEDSSKASDKVRITPKKKWVKVSIDRELVVVPKKKKEKNKDKDRAQNDATTNAEQSASDEKPEDAAKAGAQAGAESDRPADPGSVTTTSSPAHAATMMRDAMDAVFAPNLDDQMIAAMPSFWKFYYQAAAAQSEYHPTDPAILRQNAVDQKAKIVSAFEPPSNEFAQTCGIVGMAQYHVVIGTDGKPQEIVVGRPIGFGLDENAADTIRKATFEPAMKDGKAVPVLLDVDVQFRIYSKRTDRPAATNEQASEAPKLPGPYSTSQP